MVETITNNIFFQKILLVTLITILPLIPAYILFKFLPAKSIVTGPFKGLNVNFSGATAIYFIIFVTIFTTSQFWELEKQKNENMKDFEVWTVKGQLKANDIQDYEEINYNDEGFKINVLPEDQPDRNGVFSVTVLRKREDNKMVFPNLYFHDDDGDYTTETIYLDSSTVKADYEKYDIQRIDSIETIRINNPISLIKDIDL